MSTYQPNIPTGNVDLDIDYLNIQGNFQQLDTSFGVDHVTFSNVTPQNGYHTSVHFNPISTTATNPPNNQPVVAPATVAGIGQLFSSQINDGNTVDTALYFLTGNGLLTQMTANIQPVLAQNGYTFLPGGLLMQWGIVTPIATAIVTVNLPIPFKNNFFNVSITPIKSGGTISNADAASNAGLSIGPPFPSFQCRVTGTLTGIFFIAIGN